MLEFEEYKVKLNNLKPELEELYTSLGLEQAKREVEELEIKSSQPGFWDNPEESQDVYKRQRKDCTRQRSTERVISRYRVLISCSAVSFSSCCCASCSCRL